MIDIYEAAGMPLLITGGSTYLVCIAQIFRSHNPGIWAFGCLLGTMLFCSGIGLVMVS